MDRLKVIMLNAVTTTLGSVSESVCVSSLSTICRSGWSNIFTVPTIFNGDYGPRITRSNASRTWTCRLLTAACFGTHSLRASPRAAFSKTVLCFFQSHIIDKPTFMWYNPPQCAFKKERNRQAENERIINAIDESNSVLRSNSLPARFVFLKMISTDQSKEGNKLRKTI